MSASAPTLATNEAPEALGVNLSMTEGFKYGLMGLPLAFVALPLYVLLPNHYAREFGVPLAYLGAVLLGARLFDALIDPLLGRLSDHLLARSRQAVLLLSALASVVLLIAFTLLFFPPVRSGNVLLLWATALLLLTYTAYSMLNITHQAWGAMLASTQAMRSQVFAWREGLGLIGVVLAAVLPAVMDLRASVVVFGVALSVGWLAWCRVRVPGVVWHDAVPSRITHNLWEPLCHSEFRRLLGVFLINGIASAVPATLVLFYVQDRLQATRSLEPVFLGSYFVCAALSIPLWLRLVARIGLARTWGMGMLLAIVVFVWAALLGAGDVAAFIVVCALSGVALGTDLALPSAMLAGVIANAGHSGNAEGLYFGWWNLATKLNLALAAGLALPLLDYFGYSPGARDPHAMRALVAAYSLLPCTLKLLAVVALYRFIIHPQIAKEIP
jgi:glycoside/pentoside/hexuronide:cation symporter, GPH family